MILYTRQCLHPHDEAYTVMYMYMIFWDGMVEVSYDACNVHVHLWSECVLGVYVYIMVHMRAAVKLWCTSLSIASCSQALPSFAQ